jgi:hypothetical protein
VARSAPSARQRPEATSKTRKFVGKLANVLGLVLKYPRSLPDRHALRAARDKEIVGGRTQCPAGKIDPLCCSDDSGVFHRSILRLQTIYPGSLSHTAGDDVSDHS